MRNFLHQSGFSQTHNFWKTATLALGLLLAAGSGALAEDATWTGTASTNFMVGDNWDPVGAPVSGSNYTIPVIEYDSVGTLVSASTNEPTLSGSENVTVKFFYGAYGDGVTTFTRTLTVNLDPTATLTSTDGGSTINYNSVNLIVNSGSVYFENYERPTNLGASWVINGGAVYCARNNRTMQIGNSNSPTSGGQFVINGGLLYIRGGGIGRQYYAREGGQFVITGDGILKFDGDQRFYQQYIESGWMNGGENYYPVMNYDAVSNVTTFTAVPTDTVMFRSSEDVELSLGDNIDVVYLVYDKAVRNAKSIAWKYRKEGSSEYTAFAGADSSSFAPIFTESGTFYLMAEITDSSDVVTRSADKKYKVYSKAVTLSPSLDIQYIRVGEAGTKITASFADGKVPSSMEWKYSMSKDGPFLSFEPAQTSATINPVFNVDSVGVSYYLVMDATIDGVAYTTKALNYVVEANTAVGRAITWTGEISTDIKDPGNWNPVASYFKNSLTINALTDSLANYPVLDMTGNDTIQNLYLYGGSLTVNGSEAGDYILNLRSNVYIQAPLVLNNVYISYPTGYFRVPTGAGVMTMNGVSSLYTLADTAATSTILMGNSGTPTTGGMIIMNDESSVYAESIDRVVTAKNDSSVFVLNDNAKLYYVTDVRSKLQTWADSTKIRCGEEGYVPYIIYDSENDWTVVSARNTNSFSIADDSKTYTTAGNPTEATLNVLDPAGSVNSFEWKYSTSINGPWSSFATAAKDENNFTPVFDAAGTYYVVAEDQAGNLTSNMKEIIVLDVTILPAEQQWVALGAACKELTLSPIDSTFTLSNGMWVVTREGEEILVVEDTVNFKYTPAFEEAGTYEVFYLATVLDENSVSYDLKSNTVTVEYGATFAPSSEVGKLSIYPNPTDGIFYVNGGDDTYKVEIFSMNGTSCLYSEIVADGGEKAINLGQRGVFVVKTTSGSHVKVALLVVK